VPYSCLSWRCKQNKKRLSIQALECCKPHSSSLYLLLQVRTCPGGSVVVRDPANDCEFQACPNAVRVDATLEYGFFDGTTLRSPTEAEYIGVMVETSKFYTQDLRRTFPNLDTAVSVRSSQSFNPSDTNLPVRINFSLISFFLDGTTNPTQAQILSAIAAADYQSK